MTTISDENGREAAPGSAVPPPLSALVGQVGALKERPIERWNPPFCGELDIRIDGAGGWHYAGSPIARAPLVQLFASILRREDDGNHYLVTPVEKVRIQVDDVAVMGVELRSEGAGEGRVLGLRTSFDDWVMIGPDHPLRFETETGTGGLKPYVALRRGLEAKLTRALVPELVEWAETRVLGGVPVLGVASQGVFFPLPGEGA